MAFVLLNNTKKERKVYFNIHYMTNLNRYQLSVCTDTRNNESQATISIYESGFPTVFRRALRCCGNSRWRHLSLTSQVLYMQCVYVGVSLMFGINLHPVEKEVILTNENKLANQLFKNYKCNLQRKKLNNIYLGLFIGILILILNLVPSRSEAKIDIRH